MTTNITTFDPAAIDLARLRHDMRTLEHELCELKRSLRRTWTQPMAEVQAQHLCCSARVTGLYTLRAWMRGRIHRLHPPPSMRDYCRAMGEEPRWDPATENRTLAERVARDYLREPAREAKTA